MTRKSLAIGVTLAAVLAASAAVAPSAYAQSDDGNTVDAVEAVGRAPTSVTIHVAGKRASAVRGAVLAASHTVCKNAVSNYEVWLVDFYDCQNTTFKTAMADYGRMVRAHPGIATRSADAGLIHIAAR